MIELKLWPTLRLIINILRIYNFSYLCVPGQALFFLLTAICAGDPFRQYAEPETNKNLIPIQHFREKKRGYIPAMKKTRIHAVNREQGSMGLNFRIRRHTTAKKLQSEWIKRGAEVRIYDK